MSHYGTDNFICRLLALLVSLVAAVFTVQYVTFTSVVIRLVGSICVVVAVNFHGFFLVVAKVKLFHLLPMKKNIGV